MFSSITYVLCQGLNPHTTCAIQVKHNYIRFEQLSRMFLKLFDFNGLYVMFNFDNSVLFSKIEQLLPFYKAILKCFNKAYVSDRPDFVSTIMNQPLWGNKYITILIRSKKNVLFLRNWIRSDIRRVGDLVFTDGILDENDVHQNLFVNKTCIQR